MAKRRRGVEQITSKLRQADVPLTKGQPVAKVVRRPGITKQTYCRWREECSDLRTDRAVRLRELEKENARLKRLAAGFSLDNAILEAVT